MAKSVTEIKVLNIAQPNAHNVIFNGKNVENRSGICNFRGTIAIYASKTVDKSRFEGSDVKLEECALGAIIGLVDIVDCIIKPTDSTKKWFQGPYGYVLENVVTLKNPLPVKLEQGPVIFWTLKGKDLEKLLSQVNSDKIKPITKVASDKNAPVPKTSGRAKLKPSKNLAIIIGDKPTNFKQAYNQLTKYINVTQI